MRVERVVEVEHPIRDVGESGGVGRVCHGRLMAGFVPKDQILDGG